MHKLNARLEEQEEEEGMKEEEEVVVGEEGRRRWARNGWGLIPLDWRGQQRLPESLTNQVS